MIDDSVMMVMIIMTKGEVMAADDDDYSGDDHQNKDGDGRCYDNDGGGADKKKMNI